MIKFERLLHYPVPDPIILDPRDYKTMEEFTEVLFRTQLCYGWFAYDEGHLKEAALEWVKNDT